MRNRILIRRNREVSISHGHHAWQRQPILWLGAAIFAASLAGCVWMIVVALHDADAPLADADGAAMDMPGLHSRASTRSPTPVIDANATSPGTSIAR